MANLCEFITTHLKRMLEQAENGVIEIKRSELADHFGCAPSQINYVLVTRFNPEAGYLVESRRGGGGYIRIIKRRGGGSEIRHLVRELIGEELDQRTALNYVKGLLQRGEVTEREAEMMASVVDREVLAVELPLRDQLRANLMRAMLLALVRM